MSKLTTPIGSSAVIEAPSCPKQRGYISTMLRQWGQELKKLDRVKDPQAVARLECRVSVFRTALKCGKCYADEVIEVGRFEPTIVRNAFSYLLRLMRNWQLGHSVPTPVTA